MNMSSKVDGDKLKTVKTEIHCTLVSTKNGLTLRDFLRDYKETIGKPFPHAAFGYKNAMDFLKSIPDVVNIGNTLAGPELLFPVETKKSGHINKFMLEQKPSKRTMRRPRPVQLPTDSRQFRPPSGLFPTPREQPPATVRGWEKMNNMDSFKNNCPSPITNNNKYSTYGTDWFGYQTLPPLLNNCPKPLIENNRINSLFQPQFQNLSKQDHPFTLSSNESSNQQPYEKPHNDANQNMLANGGANDFLPVKGNLSDHEKNLEDSKSFSKDEKKMESKEEVLGHEDNEIDDLMYDYDSDGGCSSHIGGKMRMNFRAVLSDHPNGILTSKFHLAYEKKFGVPLNQNDLGFQSIKELVMACPDVFIIHKTKKQGDWLLFDSSSNVISPDDSSKWIPKQVLENMEQLSRMNPKGISSDDILIAYQSLFNASLDFKKLGFESLTSFLVNCQSVECKTEDDKCFVYPFNWGQKLEMPSELDGSVSDPFLSLENVQFLWKKSFDENVCDPTFKFGNFILPQEKTFKVLVSDALSPDVIWLQNASTGELLTNLMFELNNFYDKEEDNYKLDGNMLIPGLACCVKFNPVNRWHRAIIYPPSDEGVKVLYVDYGTTGFVKIDELRTLHRRFSELPIQAIKAKLHNIEPVDKSGWKEDALEYLFSTCLENVFVAEIITVKPEIPFIEVILCDTKGDEDIVINDALIFNKFALPKIKVPYTDVNSSFHSTSLPFTSYPQCFINLLPPWLSITKEWTLVCQLLKQAKNSYMKDGDLWKTSNNNSAAPPSCCSHHMLSFIFVNKPKMFCDVWYKTIEPYSSNIEHQFIRKLSIEMALPLNLKDSKQLCYMEKNICNKSIDGTREKFMAKINNEQTTEDDLCLRSYDNVKLKYDNVSNSECTQHSRAGEVYKFHSSFADNSDAKSSYTKSGREVKRHIISARIGGKHLHVVRLNNEVYVLIDELLKTFARSVPKVLAFHRILGSRLDIKTFVISPENELLHEKLVMNNVIKPDEQVALVPLTKAGDFLIAADPLQKSIAVILRGIARTCTADHSHWFE